MHMKTPPPTPVLSVKDLTVDFKGPRGTARILEGIEFGLFPGEILALVGETGCGKSITAKSILDLIPLRSLHRTGTVSFEGLDLFSLDHSEFRSIRGRSIAMIFQNPQSSINPVFTLGEQMYRLIRMYLKNEIDAVCQHQGLNKKAAIGEIAREKLAEVGLTETDRLLKSYAHEISGGMAQRYKIAQALLSSPEILIADEATSALDVTVQAHILKLLKQMSHKKGTTILFITHDLGIAAQICDRVAVMYAGRIVEIGNTMDIFQTPLHPYTRGLLESVPKLGYSETLQYVSGMIPDLVNPPRGCRFHPRCAHKMTHCEEQRPMNTTSADHHTVACHLYSR